MHYPLTKLKKSKSSCCDLNIIYTSVHGLFLASNIIRNRFCQTVNSVEVKKEEQATMFFKSETQGQLQVCLKWQPMSAACHKVTSSLRLHYKT